MRKTICLLAVAVLLMASVNAQQSGPVKYSVNAPDSMTVNDTGRIEISFSFEEGWYGYAETASNIAAGWIPTKVEFEFPDGFEKTGALIIPKSIFKAGAEVYIGKDLKFVQTVKYTGRDKDGKPVSRKERIINVTVHYQTCDEEKCLPPVTETVAVKITGH